MFVNAFTNVNSYGLIVKFCCLILLDFEHCRVTPIVLQLAKSDSLRF